MNNREEPDPRPRDKASARRASDHASPRMLARAVAERAEGRRRLNATTVTVSFASVAVAGVVVAVLPGSTHATVKSSQASSVKSTPSSTPSSSGSSTSDSGTIQAPATTPIQSSGGGGSTSGGS